MIHHDSNSGQPYRKISFSGGNEALFLVAFQLQHFEQTLWFHRLINSSEISLMAHIHAGTRSGTHSSGSLPLWPVRFDTARSQKVVELLET